MLRLKTRGRIIKSRQLARIAASHLATDGGFRIGGGGGIPFFGGPFKGLLFYLGYKRGT